MAGPAANPGLETCIGKRCGAVRESPDGLIRMDVPPGTRHVRLVYHNALLLPSVMIALVTVVVYLLQLFRSRRAKGNAAEAELSACPADPGT